MDRLREASLWSKIALGLQCSAFLFGIIGIPTPYWATVGSTSVGLFEVCESVLGQGCFNVPEYQKTSAQHVGGGLCMTGFLVGILCLANILLVTILQLMKPTGITRTISTATAFFSGNLILSGAIAFAALTNNDAVLVIPTYGWSFGFTIMAALCHEVCGVILIIDKRAAFGK